ncbi:Ras GTPase-activating-like protein rng2 isoform 2 [Hibiscus syriacus]|uniref:Ras GTPase-activating-like protein rng2 isoform 2 n=1 Tax=Hibiscus syriacus TaxID=106335 RepID=A0A6A2XHM7_HIBSY|nr:Ras GTPase-activating-like protein rng2 isoform 2 [Hibiscus syriacus]
MMVCFCSQNVRDCLHDHDKLLDVAVILIYIQIGCSLIGSLGALYNGVLLMNLGIALFALVAISSSSHSLGRAYAVLLFCAIVLDISWFFLFCRHIWNMSSQSKGTLFVFSLRLTLAMEILGVLHSRANTREPDFDLRNSFLNPPTLPNSRQRSNSDSDDALVSYYSPLFEDCRAVKVHFRVIMEELVDINLLVLKVRLLGQFLANHVENAAKVPDSLNSTTSVKNQLSITDFSCEAS